MDQRDERFGATSEDGEDQNTSRALGAARRRGLVGAGIVLVLVLAGGATGIALGTSDGEPSAPHRTPAGRRDAPRPDGSGAGIPPALIAAMGSIVRIDARGSRCDRTMQGTGFVVAREHVMTAAHVVAGTDGRAEAMAEGGEGHRATVVLYDPRRDLAVLRVPGLAARTLPLDRGGRRGDRAVMAGFRAASRSLSVRKAGILTENRATGPDLYHHGSVVRRIFQISASVDPGLSGSPLLALDGAVVGMVFAGNIEENAGFALTAKEITSSVRKGATRTRPVSTGECAG